MAGLGFWGSWSGWTWAAVVAPLLVLAGIAGTVAVWVVRDPGARVMHAVAADSPAAASGSGLRRISNVPSAANSTRLRTVTQTCGCASASPALNASASAAAPSLVPIRKPPPPKC